MIEKEEESYASLISEAIEEEWKQGAWDVIESAIPQSQDPQDEVNQGDFERFATKVSQRLVPKIELQILEENIQEIKKRILDLQNSYKTAHPLDWKLDFAGKISALQSYLEFLERKMAERKPK